MLTSPVVDQEFIVHLFAPLDGPHAPAAYEQVQDVWTACRDRLGLTGGGIDGVPGPGLPSPAAIREAGTEAVLAFQQGPTGLRQAVLRQAVLRRVHDVLNLSVALARPVRAAGQPQRELNWTNYAALWARVSPREPASLLGEAQLLIARAEPGKDRVVAATTELGQALGPLLPYREDRPRGWWRHGTTTSAGYALWDTGVADTAAIRELVLVAAADQDEELSAWTWSDRTPALPPFGRYLMHAAKLRYEARLLGSWYDSTAAARDAGPVVAELSAVLEMSQPDQERARLLSSLQGRLRAEVNRLTHLDADMARLQQTASLAQRNLAAQPGCGPLVEPTGFFAADQSLARYVADQVSSDRNYLQIELNRAKSMREMAAEALTEAERPWSSRDSDACPASDGPQASQPDAARRVFVVYGRDSALTKGFFDLLYSIGLQPLEWERLVGATGTTLPFLAEVVRNAPCLAQATLVLLSPDDVVELHSDLYQENDQGFERGQGGQARPNVLFELGLAYMAYPERTVIVEVGQLRRIADLAGLNAIRFDGSPTAVKKIIDRLVQAGCPADTSGDHWLDPHRFAGLDTYQRGPATHQHPCLSEAKRKQSGSIEGTK